MIGNDALFVMETIILDFRKDVTQDLEILLQKVKDKVFECKIITDDPNANHFLCITTNFKASNFGTIFKINRFPFSDNKEFIDIKLLFRCSLAIRCEELKLHEFYWG